MAVPASTRVVARKTVAICGNPNCGKTTIFNAITGLNQQIGNYPGVTVEKVSGQFTIGQKQLTLVDIPGAYSLSAFSPDEQIAALALYGNLKDNEIPDVIVCVIDTTNLERGLYLLYQILQIGQPIVVALNMIDLSRKMGVRIDTDKLSRLLGGVPVVPVIGSRGKGIEKLKQKISDLSLVPIYPADIRFDDLTEEILKELLSLTRDCRLTRAEGIRLIFDLEPPDSDLNSRKIGRDVDKFLADAREKLRQKHGSLSAAETTQLSNKAKAAYDQVVTIEAVQARATSEKIDRFVLNPVLGLFILVGTMFFVFQSIFSWAEPFMGMIDSLFGAFGAMVEASMPDGPLRSLLVDGIIGGVGSVLIFIPQIAILFIFISLLEDSGYMARAAFLVDRMFRWCGLSGKSFIPMLSSFACAVPGIMATRTIEDRKLRLITIMVAPLMTCSARLPVYAVMIAAFVPYKMYFGLFNLQGLVLSLLYLLGIIVAVIVSFILSRTILKTKRGTFLMEMPSYKIPTARSVIIRVLNRLKTFVIRAGTVIMAITIIIWALSYYPRGEEIVTRQLNKTEQLSAHQTEESVVYESIAAVLVPSGTDQRLLNLFEHQFEAAVNLDEANSIKTRLLAENPADNELIDFVHGASVLRIDHELAAMDLANRQAGERLRQSYFGRMGRFVEPAFVPLGWDWKITMSVLAAFPAREVIIATIGTIYNLGSEVNEESNSLISKLRAAKWEDGPRVGTPVFSGSVAISIMVFFALCCQCGATLVTIRQETSGWKYPIFVFTYMTALAYLGAFLSYQLLHGMGL